MTKPVDGTAVTIAPTWSVRAERYQDDDPRVNGRVHHVELIQPGIGPSPYGEDAESTDSADFFQGGLSFDPAGDCRDDVILASNLIAASAVCGFHEALEWVQVDGRRLGEPHPVPEDEMWDWLMEQMLDVLARYRKKWPQP